MLGFSHFLAKLVSLFLELSVRFRANSHDFEQPLCYSIHSDLVSSVFCHWFILTPLSCQQRFPGLYPFGRGSNSIVLYLIRSFCFNSGRLYSGGSCILIYLLTKLTYLLLWAFSSLFHYFVFRRTNSHKALRNLWKYI